MHHRHQIFISSQMKRGTLNDVRRSARKVINKFKYIFMPWDWEHDGTAGPQTPIDYCLNEVRRSHALVLIVSSTLTKHTHEEYKIAKNEGKNLFIFFKKGCQRGESLSFQKRLKPSWREFQNISEFETMLFNSLQELAYTAIGEYKATPSMGTAYKGTRS